LEVEESEGEFSELIPLEGIPKQLHTMMYEVAPMLRGHNVVYQEEFFDKVVGLYNKGCKVDKAFYETKVTIEEVAVKGSQLGEPNIVIQSPIAWILSKYSVSRSTLYASMGSGLTTSHFCGNF